MDKKVNGMNKQEFFDFHKKWFLSKGATEAFADRHAEKITEKHFYIDEYADL